MLLVYGRPHNLELYGTAARIMMLHIILYVVNTNATRNYKIIKQRIVSRDFAWHFFVIYKCFSIPCQFMSYSVSPPPVSIEWFIEDQAFFRSYCSAPRPPPSPSPFSKLSLFLSLPVCRRSSLLTGWAISIRRRESLALYKSFNTLCAPPSLAPAMCIISYPCVLNQSRAAKPSSWFAAAFHWLL